MMDIVRIKVKNLHFFQISAFNIRDCILNSQDLYKIEYSYWKRKSSNHSCPRKLANYLTMENQTFTESRKFNSEKNNLN